MYAKTKSNAVAKLDGTFKIPTAAADVKVTDLQQSIFNAPVPGAANASTSSNAPPKAPAGGDQVMTDAGADRGTKRVREDEPEEESDSDVAMEEDSDDE